MALSLRAWVRSAEEGVGIRTCYSESQRGPVSFDFFKLSRDHFYSQSLEEIQAEEHDWLSLKTTMPTYLGLVDKMQQPRKTLSDLSERLGLCSCTRKLDSMIFEKS